MSAAKSRRATRTRKPTTSRAAAPKPVPRKPAARKPAARKPAARKRASASAAQPAPRKSPARKHSAGSAATPATPTVLIGKPVQEFSLPASGGGIWQLRDAHARKLVLYFYPRDNTPGCTLEGQQFAALAPRFERAGAAIVGISRDSVASHDRFRGQMNFPFLLLSDVDGLACGLFDVIREKNMYGRKVMGIERSTFLLDGEGILRREWRKLKVEGHALAVLEAVQAL